MLSFASAVAFGAPLLSLLLTPAAAQTYTLANTFQGNNFFNNFNFFTGADPTHGFVSYQSQSQASSVGLIATTSSYARMFVDSRSTLSTTGPGRRSVRIESKTRYTHGLFLADIRHMPGSACGVWPAFWSLGSGTWPMNGEVDIIEGVNRNTRNLFSAHTSDGCSISGAGETGTLATSNCAVSNSPTGCGVNAAGTNNYGDAFNNNGGGVYAMQWTSSFIKIWFFPRNAIPASITAGNPNVAAFGTPQANFAGNCNIDTHFRDHQFIFDTTFCGDWAGNVYGTSGCPSYAGLSSTQACVRYVAQNPSAFRSSYWEINYLKIYREATTTTAAAATTSSSSNAARTLSKAAVASPAAASASHAPSAAPSSSSKSPARANILQTLGQGVSALTPKAP